MSREKIQGGFRYNCNGHSSVDPKQSCPANNEQTETDPRAAWAGAAADGWVMMQGKRELEHLCPRCKKLAGD